MGVKTLKRYSTAIKLKVIEEIEQGIYTIIQASQVYGISVQSIYNWLNQFGKNHLVGKVIFVQKSDELSRVKKLEQEKRELEQALAKAHLKLFTMETLLEVVEEEYKVDLKKTFGSKLSPNVKNR